ncbi:hypothetical protein [Rothia nasimurium]|uniref:hypothetical protein n=1 Tax=Rothia nasimurium TaxID=85336 RepID=UPI001F3D11F9|nr:hypothetical protein [Rothia nasimurium]
MAKTMTRLLAAGSALSALGAASLFMTSTPGSQMAAPAPSETVHSAPAPQQSFMDVTCQPPAEIGPIPQLSPMSWWAPSINAGASFIPSTTLPTSATTNDGIIYSHSEEIGSSQGVSLLVGHVDFEPGAISEDGGELTAWGQLHELSECALVFTADENGNVVASQLTSLYTAPQLDETLEQKAAAAPGNGELQSQLQQQREVQARVFRSTGSYTITLLTCSGPSVADVGGDFQFRYSDNLIAETTPLDWSH